jgi:hypothetical protein
MNAACGRTKRWQDQIYIRETLNFHWLTGQGTGVYFYI